MPMELMIPTVQVDLTPVTLTNGQAPSVTSTPPRVTDAETEEVRKNVEASDAENTRRAYTSAWASFTRWCGARGATPLPALPETLAYYLSTAVQQNGRPYSVGALNLHLSAIKRAHRERNLLAPVDHPIVHRTWNGIRNRRGTWQEGAKPLTADLLHKVLDVLPNNVRGVRDRLLLLIGFGGAFRRSELTDLKLEDVVILPSGLRLNARRRKTGDDDILVDLAKQTDPRYCPVDAVCAWLDALAADSSLLVRLEQPLLLSTRGGARPWIHPEGISDATVRNVVIRALKDTGVDPKRYSAHSLRSGFATSASEAGISAMQIRDAGGWRSLTMVDRYVKHRRRLGPDAPRSRVLAAIQQE